MPRKNKALAPDLTSTLVPLAGTSVLVSTSSGPEGALTPDAPDAEFCGHVNRHYVGKGECVCDRAKGHAGNHAGNYRGANADIVRGSWSDAAAFPVEEIVRNFREQKAKG
jgi:hypothetical protein